MANLDLSQLHDFRYYASKCLWILNRDNREWERFSNWFEAQEIVHKSIEKDIADRRPIRKIILKARQEGISTYTQGRIFHQAHTIANTKALILSHDIESAGKIFNMTKSFYEKLPDSIRPMKRYSNKRELVFENPDEKTRSQNPGLQSSIEVQTAGKWTPSRGAMYHLVHFSEVAFWPGTSAEIVTAILPMVPHVPGTMIVYESTANGMENDFYDDWLSAKEGETEFDPIFIPWFRMQTYSLAFRSRKDRKKFESPASQDSEFLDEERELKKRFKLTDEQLNWRRMKIREFGGDIYKFYQEYPSTDREAFVFQNPTIFNRKKLEQIEVTDPLRVCDISIDNQDFRNNPEGNLSIWEEPQPGAEYVIGVDVASGEGDDYSVCCVLKRTWPNGLCDQVAEWHGKCHPIPLAKYAVIMARHYNDAMLSIELNNHGFTTQVEAKNFYWNFYRWQYMDRQGGNTMTNKIGWETNLSTKKILVDRAVDCIDAEVATIRSEGLLDEMWKYVKIRGTQSFESERGNDDRVMAWMIGVTTLYITQMGLDFNSMNVKAQVTHGPTPDISDLPRKGDPLMMGKPALVDQDDPRGRFRESQVSWQNL